jgi:septal ring factor EnvC (AmiA/AmiB activator)
MTRAGRTFTVVLVAALGVWGCARGPASHYAAQAERIRTLENKCAKLEEDYRAVALARDSARKRVAALEEESNRLVKQLADYQAVVKERDGLRQQLDSRTSERDLLQARCDRMKKGLQNLLGQDDAMLNSGNAPVTTATTGPRLNPS